MWLDFGLGLNRNQNHPPKPKKKHNLCPNLTSACLTHPSSSPLIPTPPLQLRCQPLRPLSSNGFYPTFPTPSLILHHLHLSLSPAPTCSSQLCLVRPPAFFPCHQSNPHHLLPHLRLAADPSIFSPTLFSNLAAIVDCKLCLFQFLIEFSFHPNRKETDRKFRLVSDRFG